MIRKLFIVIICLGIYFGPIVLLPSDGVNEALKIAWFVFGWIPAVAIGENLNELD